MSTTTTTLSRRAILGAMAVAMPAATFAAVGNAVERQDERAGVDPNAAFIAELDAFDAWTLRLNSDKSATEDEWARWDVQMGKLYRRAEALPATRENVPAKMRAIRSICLEEPLSDEDCDGDTTTKLAMHIVRALMEA